MPSTVGPYRRSIIWLYVRCRYYRGSLLQISLAFPCIDIVTAITIHVAVVLIKSYLLCLTSYLTSSFFSCIAILRLTSLSHELLLPCMAMVKSYSMVGTTEPMNLRKMNMYFSKSSSRSRKIRGRLEIDEEGCGDDEDDVAMNK